MSEDIHNSDEQFKNAYGGFEEEPSADVWNKINAELDRQDAVYYRRKFVAWKYIACLLVLLSGSVLAWYTYFDTPDKTSQVIPAQQSTNGMIDTPAQASSNNRKNEPSKKSDTQQAYSLPDGKTDFSPDNLASADKNKSRTMGGSNTHENLNAIPDEQAHSPLDYPLSFNTHKDINQLHSDSIKIVTGKQDNNFNQPGNDVTKVIIAEKKEQNNNPVNKPDSVHQATDNVSSKQIDDSSSIVLGYVKGNDDSASIAQSYVKENDDSDLITKNNQDNQIFIAKPDSASAQQSTRTTIKIKPRFSPYWAITPFASADIMSYQLDDDDRHRSGNEPDDKEDIQERENHELSYTTGVMASLQYTPKIGFTTGLQYSHISININPQTLYADRDNNQNLSYKFITSSGYGFVDAKNGNQPNTGDSVFSDGAEHNLEYLNLPLLITYKLYNRKKFSIDAGAGLAAHLLLSSKVEAEIKEAAGDDEHITIRKLQGMRHQYFSFVADASLQWRINSRFSFALLPSFKYAIAPITKENIVKTFPFGAGIGAGISYRL